MDKRSCARQTAQPHNNGPSLVGVVALGSTAGPPSIAGLATQDLAVENNIGKLKQPTEQGRSAQKTRKR